MNQQSEVVETEISHDFILDYHDNLVEKGESDEKANEKAGELVPFLGQTAQIEVEYTNDAESEPPS